MLNRSIGTKLNVKNPVLIFEGGLNSLVAARYFNKYGLTVYLATTEKSDFSLFSRYFKKEYLIPNLWDSENLKRTLKRVSKRTNKRLAIYAGTDLAAFYLSKLKSEVRDDYHFVVADHEATKILVEKRKFYQQLEKNHTNYPTTFYPNDITEANKIKSRINYPVFIRPNITKLFLNEFGHNHRKGFIARSAKELVHYYKLAKSHNVSVMFQEIIPGPPTNSFQLETYYDKEFCSTGFFARQRLRIWPLDFGNTTLCVSIPLSRFDNERKELNNLMKNIRYNGLASAELKIDPRDNKPKFLEVNARLWSHFWLSAECGVDILLSSYLDAIGEKNVYPTTYKVGIKSVYFTYDIIASARLLMAHELRFRDWISSYKGKKVPALLNRRDPLPLIMDLKSALNYKINPRNLLRSPTFGSSISE